MLKKIVKILSDPLLYYVDQSKKSVFRNYCLLSGTGCSYNVSIPKANVGKALEFRFRLDKYLKWTYFLTPVVLYFIFIHLKFALLSLLFFELLWILIVNGARLLCSYIYSSYLMRSFGKYEIVDFTPPVPKRKFDEYAAVFKSKIIAGIVALVVFFTPAFFIQWGIGFNLKSKHHSYKAAVKLADTYFLLYPKSEKIYDMRAYAKFMVKDYEGALNDYKTVLNMSGRKFSKRDFSRLANLLLLQKKLTTAQEAIDVFNEYVTKKDMSVLEASQMLWVKSIFKIENNIAEDVMQNYEDLLMSLSEKDLKNQFYISCDKAYMLYLMEDYSVAINDYNILISYAEGNKDIFAKELKSIYAERGWAKKRAGDEYGANADFIASGIDFSELPQYEPSYTNQEFVAEKF